MSLKPIWKPEILLLLFLYLHLLAKRKREEHTSSVRCLGELSHFVVGNKHVILNCLLFLQSKAIEDEKQREILEERERAAKALLEITG